MRQMLRCLARVADESSGENRRGRGEAAEGHVPVYVGEEMERFEVRMELLGRPAFLELLRWTALEYGYKQRGPLRIPCSVPLFRRVLHSLLASDDLSAETHVQLLHHRASTDV